MSIFINFEEGRLETVGKRRRTRSRSRLENWTARSKSSSSVPLLTTALMKNANIQTSARSSEEQNEMLKTKNFGRNRKSLHGIKDILVKMASSWAA